MSKRFEVKQFEDGTNIEMCEKKHFGRKGRYGDIKIENVQLHIGDRYFECKKCRANVFKYTSKNTYICNGCNAEYKIVK